MASYPLSVNPFGTIAIAGASRASLYSERTAVANLLSELTAVETDLVAARGGSGSIATRLSAVDAAVTAAQAAAISTASTDATNKANSAISTASTDATNKANAAQAAAIAAAATDATTKANNALGAALAAAPGRNRLSNGNHTVRQRGNGTFTAGGYGIDGLQNYASGSTFINSAQLHPVAGIPGVKEGGYFNRTIVSSVAGAGNYVSQVYFIEGVETLAGQVCTVSWYAKADAARPIAMEVQQIFGSGGSSQVVSIGVVKPTLSTSWVRYTSTFTMNSMSTKTIGTTGSCIGVGFWYDAGSTYDSRTSSLGQQSGTFDIDMVQLEAGANATPFEFEHPQVTLAKCQRYYQTVGSGGAGGVATATRVTLTWKLPVQMRAAPAFVKLAEMNVRHANADFTSTASTSINVNTTSDGFMLSIEGFTALTLVGGGCVSAPGSVKMYSLSAEF